MSPILLWSKRILLLAFFGLSIGLSLSYRLGKVGPDDFIDARRPTEQLNTSAWIKNDSDDWLRLAEIASDAQSSQELALKAFSIDITSGRAAASLADAYLNAAQKDVTEQLANLAGKLTTAQNSTHTRLAALWGKLNAPDKVLAEWDILLTRDVEMRNSMWPYLQEKLSEPNLAIIFDKLASENSNWWPSFFIFLTRNPNSSPNLLEHFYNLRSANKLLTENEITTYVARLIQDKEWIRAKRAWELGLSPEQVAYKGLIYDGSFEGEQHNTGFDWYFAPPKQIKISPDITFGMQGKKALHINFLGSQRLNFQHIWQRLVLDPNDYQLTFNYRTDNFQNTKGMQWRIYCIDDNKLLAESPALTDASVWKNIQVNFNVPSTNCPAQILRLEASSKFAHEQVFNGNLWFDDFKLTKR